jgi:hypothetical protein
MPKTKTTTHAKGPTQQIAVRLDADVIDRLDAIAVKLSRPGLPLNRTDALRAALAEGMPILEKEK